MTVRAQFFSRLRDAAGASEVEIEIAEDAATVRNLLARLYEKFPGLEQWDAHVLTAVGVEYVGRDTALRGGECVAIMPPVQGG